MSKNKKYTSELIGLPGLDEEFKLCHLPFLTVDDVFGVLALEGSSGTGKTTIVNRIGKLNEAVSGGKVKTYSADKVRYEDFNGCPIPNNKTKQMDIFYMPNSISQMETVLIDEINRASYDNQEKFLSLFATREVDGLACKCKYLYAAMNPILSETDDTYEGVQPIDKALGERMLALVKMTPFSKMPTDIRIKIIQSCFNQTKWTPNEESIEEFKTFISNAKSEYEDYKNKYSECVSEYIDFIQNDLMTETKNAIKIEARRAQYILVNILAVHALNRVYSNDALKLDQSALAALLISFPNPLWEQPINNAALKQAHSRAKGYLDIKKSGGYVSINKTSLSKSLNEIQNFIDNAKKNADTKPDIEQLSKIINQNIPDEKLDYINNAVFCYGSVLGLTLDSASFNSDEAKSKNITQNIMKEQEFSRIKKVYNKVIESNILKQLNECSEYVRKNKKVPETYKFPDFIFSSDDVESAKLEFTELIGMSFSRAASAIVLDSEYKIFDINDIGIVMSGIVDTIRLFKYIKDLYDN